ncbi:hypothetical protein P168DRAFT_183586 [Aspergillus campestris IBT 28561]|uniref:SWIM-type domain-containing protein n=1 Tax=Aspergillus campestris (strain IBT 28561) TaxID=1392248 RepID=A0A2I1CXS2_ASPC2|nr:uncharacterized protein P168DRAFT_183586 [Aspergillus campestris IBT 28561]PKY02413.1 hypothetical protein P168DRAFT_183586 [Aspergillus campestris IBT 28561]
MSTLDPSTHEIPSPNTVQFVDHLVSQLQDYTTATTTDPDGNDYSGSLRHPRLVQNASAFPRALASRMPQVKQLMLTLHCLFPNELLLALDILDRGLVRRYQVEHQHQHQQDCHRHQAVNETATDSESPDNALHDRQEAQSPGNTPLSDGVFFVISTSSPGPSLTPDTRSRVPCTGQKGYEVRLHAWNCSCPIFALAAYRDPGPEDTHSHLPPSPTTAPTHQSNSSRPCSFGGALTHGATKLTPPVCKHLLACFLAARCPGVFDGEVSSASSVTVLTEDELACWCAGWGE